MHEIYSCQWDKENKVLTTPGEEEERENWTDIESAAWYRDEVGEHMEENKKNSKNQFAAPEALYDWNRKQSVKNIHERNDHRYLGSPRAATVDLSHKVRKNFICVEDSEDEENDMIEISNLSREAVIDLISKQK